MRRGSTDRFARISGHGGTGSGKAIVMWSIVLTALLASCGGVDGDNAADGGYSIRPEGLFKTGEIPGSDPRAWILPSSQRITPLAAAGSRLFDLERDDSSPSMAGDPPENETYGLPLGLAVHPSGKYIFLTNSARSDEALVVMDIATGNILQSMEEDGGYFLGLAFEPPEGNVVFVSRGGNQLVEAYAFDAATAALEHLEGRDMKTGGFVGGMCISRDGSRLLVVSTMLVGGKLSIFNPKTSELLGERKTGPKPYTVAVNPDGTKAYVSCEQSNEVDVFDISNPRRRIRKLATLPAQKNPEALWVNPEGSRLYVANSDEDSVSVFAIDSDAPVLVQTLDLRRTAGLEYGSGPNALAYSPVGNDLFVAQAGLNKLAVVDLDSMTHVGDIPTAWYPTAVTIFDEQVASDDGTREVLVVANGKGVGTPYEGSMGHEPGAVSLIPVPADGDLPALTRLVEENNAFPGLLFDLGPGPWNHPIPDVRGGPTPIKYVFIVIRENKTYDYLLGAYEPPQGEADRDPSMVMMNYEKILVNLYGLSERFAICDNYYSNAEASNEGHELVTSATVNVFMEKHVHSENLLLPIELEMVIDPVTWPMKEFIFQNALRSGISFRDYGEAIGVGVDWLIFNERYVHWSLVDPPFFWMFSEDVKKMEQRIREWESARFSGPNFPRLIFMLLPNDHTFGELSGAPTYDTMIADNDEATGLFVDWLSHSPYWMESVAFITEDDPQQGVDHVDPHRTIMLVVSPWVRRGYVSHVRYNEPNFHATVEYLLGMPPLNIFDGTAQPMYDLFDFEPDPEPYVYTVPDIEKERNLPGTSGDRRCAEMDFTEPDHAEGLTQVQRAAEAERKEAGRLSNRLQEKLARLRDGLDDIVSGDGSVEKGGGHDGPGGVLKALVESAERGDRKGFEGLLDGGYEQACALYDQRRKALHSDVLDDDLVGMLMKQFRKFRPRLVSETIQGDRAQVDVIYANGISAELIFRREQSGWKFDFSHHYRPMLRILWDSLRLLQAMKEPIQAKQDSR